MSAALDESGATVERQPLPTVLGDGPQLVRLFQNLVGNTVKYRGDAAPRIRIDAERRGAFWAIAVSDNGIGIDPKHHEKIFLIFQRLHERGRYEGSGVGLASVKRIVERHGGRIAVESALGAGATFTFLLQAVDVT